MTVNEAWAAIQEYYQLASPSAAEQACFVEASEFLIRSEESGRSDRIVALYNLASYYYAQQYFDLAQKYFQQGADLGDTISLIGLGYIWYYGRTGPADGEKAFRCFSAAAAGGNLTAAYKLSDMYRTGFYVPKDPARARAILTGLYPKVRRATSLEAPLPEVYIRLAALDAAAGHRQKAVRLYREARDFLAQRIAGSTPFFGDLRIMEQLVGELSALKKPDRQAMDFYDLFYWLQTPCRVRFCCAGVPCEVRASAAQGDCAILFDGKWYRTCADFFRSAAVNGQLLTAQYAELDAFEVMEWT